MARPPKGENDKREFIIRVRMTAAEKQKLFSFAATAGLTPSDYIRSKTIASTPHIKKASPYRETLIAALAQLGKIGSNLNQIARALNRRQDSTEVSFSNGLIEDGIKEANTLMDVIIGKLNEDGN